MLKVGIDIVDMNEDAGIRDVDGAGRIQTMLWGDTVKPDSRLTDTDFRVNGLTIGRSIDTSRGEAECLHEEVMSGGNVLVGEHGDDSFKCCHECLRDRTDGNC